MLGKRIKSGRRLVHHRLLQFGKTIPTKRERDDWHDLLSFDEFDSGVIRPTIPKALSSGSFSMEKIVFSVRQCKPVMKKTPTRSRLIFNFDLLTEPAKGQYQLVKIISGYLLLTWIARQCCNYGSYYGRDDPCTKYFSSIDQHKALNKKLRQQSHVSRDFKEIFWIEIEEDNLSRRISLFYNRARKQHR